MTLKNVTPSIKIVNLQDLYLAMDYLIETAKAAGFIEDQIDDSFEDSMSLHFPFSEEWEDE